MILGRRDKTTARELQQTSSTFPPNNGGKYMEILAIVQDHRAFSFD